MRLWSLFNHSIDNIVFSNRFGDFYCNIVTWLRPDHSVMFNFH